MSDPVTIRPSGLTTYPDCGRRWAATALREEIEAAGFKLRRLPPGIGAATGTGTHTAATWALSQKMETGELGDLSEAEDRGIEALRAEIQDGAAWDYTTPNLNAAQRQVARQARSFLVHIGAHIDPAMIESRIEAARPSGLVVSGQADIVDITATLRDIKTGTRRRNNAAQYGAYSRLLRSHGNPVLEIAEHYVPRVKADADQPPPSTVAYDLAAAEAAAENVMRRIERDLEEWRSTGNPDAFLPNPASTLCSDRWCSAWGTTFCNAWRKD